jgi:thiamine-phosphate pyrophosphorylase
VTLCLVTDRRRLVAPGAHDRDALRCLLAQVRHAGNAGVDLIQVRERDLAAAALAALVASIVDIVCGTQTRVVVNDRLDVAVACGAHGVHLRADSMPVAAARRLAPPSFLIGRSVHGLDEVKAAAGADYLIAGTVFRSASKPDDGALLGVDGLRAVVQAADAPVLAIGGISTGRLPAVSAAGAAGVAAIGLFMSQDRARPDPCRARDLDALVARTRSLFDGVNARS